MAPVTGRRRALRAARMDPIGRTPEATRPSATHRANDAPGGIVDKQTLIRHLNDDLAGEFSAIIQYTTYAAKATGPYRPQLAQFFLAEVADEQLHAQFLANKIVALGGEPTSVAREVAA